MPDYERGKEPVEINFDCITDREELRTRYQIDDKEVWLPNSEVVREDETRGTLEIPEWLAIKEGLV